MLFKILTVDANGDYTEEVPDGVFHSRTCLESVVVGDLVYESLTITKGVDTATSNTDRRTIIGIVLDKPTSTIAIIAFSGLIVGSYSFDLNEKVYLGTDGKPTTVRPTTGYLQILGHSRLTSDFDFDPINTKIKLDTFTEQAFYSSMQLALDFPWTQLDHDNLLDEPTSLEQDTPNTYTGIEINTLSQMEDWELTFTQFQVGAVYGDEGDNNWTLLNSYNAADNWIAEPITVGMYTKIRVVANPITENFIEFNLNDPMLEIPEEPWYLTSALANANVSEKYDSESTPVTNGLSQYTMDSWVGVSFYTGDIDLEADPYTLEFTNTGVDWTPCQVDVYGRDKNGEDMGIINSFTETNSVDIDSQYALYHELRFVFRPTQHAHVDYMITENGSGEGGEGSDQPPWYVDEVDAVANPNVTYESMSSDGVYAGAEQPESGLWYGLAFETLEMFDEEYTITFTDPVDYVIYSNDGDGSENVYETDGSNTHEIVIDSAFSNAVTARLAVRPSSGTSLDYNISYTSTGGEGGEDIGGESGCPLSWYATAEDAKDFTSQDYMASGGMIPIMEDAVSSMDCFYGVRIDNDMMWDSLEFNANDIGADIIVYVDGMEQESFTLDSYNNYIVGFNGGMEVHVVFTPNNGNTNVDFTMELKESLK